MKVIQFFRVSYILTLGECFHIATIRTSPFWRNQRLLRGYEPAYIQQLNVNLEARRGSHFYGDKRVRGTLNDYIQSGPHKFHNLPRGSGRSAGFFKNGLIPST